MKRTLDLRTASWRKSSYSEGGANDCVEIADGFLDVAPVRDSKAPDGPVIVFGASSWTSFLARVTEVPAAASAPPAGGP